MNSVASAYVNDFKLRLAPHTAAHSMRTARQITVVLGCIGTGTAAAMAAADVEAAGRRLPLAIRPRPQN